MKILVSFPVSTSHPFLHKQVVMTSWRLLADRRYNLTSITPAHNPFENNLHHIVRDFLAGDWDYWLSIDHDNPPLFNPLDRVEDDLDLFGFPTPVWHYTGQAQERPIYYNGYDYVPDEDAYREHADKEGLQEVDAVGTGCFLVARRVLEATWEAPFQRTYYVDGRVHKGNDIAFCERVKAAGFRIWCDYDRPCDHFPIGQLGYNEIVKAFRNLEMPVG